MMRAILKTGAMTTMLCLIGATAHADLRVAFDEGAPKDRFRVENIGACQLTGSAILFDLSTSPAGLIFDVTDQGAGVEVFQPFEIVEGAKALTSTPLVLDGETRIRLDVSELAPGEVIAFTIDVDDTLGERAITVSGEEIKGATVALVQDGKEHSTVFSSKAIAELPGQKC